MTTMWTLAISMVVRVEGAVQGVSMGDGGGESGMDVSGWQTAAAHRDCRDDCEQQRREGDGQLDGQDQPDVVEPQQGLGGASED